MKQQTHSISGIARTKQKKQFQNRIVYKCQKERNAYIRRQVGDLIKKQIGIFFATKKIQKQLQNQPKDVVYIPPKTPIERVNHFRHQQKQKQWERLRNFRSKNQQRMKKLAKKMKEKSMSHQHKSSQNIMKMSKVHKKYQQIQQKDSQKIQQLKKFLMTNTPRPSTRMYSSLVIPDEILLNRVSTAKQITKRKEQESINTYLHKMKILEQRRIKKQLKMQTKRQQAAKNLPKCNIGMRDHKQQQLMNTWSAEFQKRFERFWKNKRILQKEKRQVILQRSAERNLMKQQVLERKYQNEQKQAQQRIKLLQNKINKINNAPGRRFKQDCLQKSQSNFVHNNEKQKQEFQKQHHNTIMRKVYHIVERLKSLNQCQQLKQHQIDLLIENLDPKQNLQQYKQIFTYINSTRQKYMEIKRRQQEQRAKKNKKNVQKIL